MNWEWSLGGLDWGMVIEILNPFATVQCNIKLREHWSDFMTFAWIGPILY